MSPTYEGEFRVLGQDNHCSESITFSPTWCAAFFRHSGDQNTTLHSTDQKNLVQGVAVLTKIGTIVSKHMPGYMVVKIGELSFKRPVYIGETVRLTLVRMDSKKQLTKLHAKLTIGDEEILDTTVTLASERLLDRM